MGYPRTLLVVPDVAGTYHCVSRCVRRAFLCGDDAASGRNFDHRKQWLEDRLIELAEVFSVSVLAYAVMSNHLHVVVHVDPLAAATWSDEDIATRWVRIFPVRIEGAVDEEGCQRKAAAMLGNAERLQEVRRRLADLSWFMRCLSEPIARLANAEDRCTGRFWEGRFKCQALLDDAAVLACMTYVDLNPVRAGIADDLSSSTHTSICRRLQQPSNSDDVLDAVAGPSRKGCLPISESAYIQLVDWTGRQLHPGKRGVINANAPSALRTVADAPDWLRQVQGVESRYCRAIGSKESLVEKAKAMGQRWLMVRRSEIVLV
jgi:REP element-mobilizing transposase RayT